MLFYFLISIVFIAEIVIAFATVTGLFKLNKVVNEYNSFIKETQPLIKDIMVTSRKLSEQFAELAPIIVKKIKSTLTNIIAGQLKSALGAITFWLVKKEVEKHV